MVKIIYESILWALVIGILFTIFVIKPACAEGMDHGKGIYSKDVIILHDNIEEWNYYQGVWIKRLPIVHVPKRNDFYMFTCYNSRRTYDGGKCTNRDWDDIDDNNHHDNKDVPEPEIFGLLGIGLLVMGVMRKVRGKL
jgi:hypothetical protein